MGLYRITNNKSKISLMDILFVLLNVLGLILQSLDDTGIIYISATLVTGVVIYISTIKDINENLLSNLGKYSYSIYLLHVPIGVYLTNTIINPSYNKHLYLNIVSNIIIYLTVLLISKIVYKQVELPFIKIGKDISKHYLLRFYQ